MTRRYRRQRQQYLFAAALGLIGVINLLFFLILYRPARSEFYRLEESVESQRREVQTRRYSIERLVKLSAQLETSAQDRQRLYTKHFIPLEAGWSEILVRLDAMIQKAGVRNTSKNYAIASAPQYGLHSVTINMPVVGRYSNIVNLIKDIEESSTFFIINSIDVRGVQVDSDTAGGIQQGALGGIPQVNEIGLALNIETFFYQ
jgi:hypothetical protein